MTYQVHQRLLAQKSPYFAALSNFREGKEHCVVLSNIEHVAFDRLLQWLYEGHFGLNLDVENDDNHEVNEVYLSTMIGVWAAADRLMMSMCKNKAMDILREILQVTFVRAQHLQAVNSLGYAMDSKLAQYLLDQIAYDCINLAPNHTDYTVEPTDPDTAKELTTRIIAMAQRWCRSKLNKDKAPKELALPKGCRYQEHVEGEECYLPKEI